MIQRAKLTSGKCHKLPDYAPGKQRNSRTNQQSSVPDVISFLKDFYLFIRSRKKYYLLPLVMILLLLGVFIILTEGSAVAPFIYALF